MLLRRPTQPSINSPGTLYMKIIYIHYDNKQYIKITNQGDVYRLANTHELALAQQDLMGHTSIPITDFLANKQIIATYTELTHPELFI